MYYSLTFIDGSTSKNTWDDWGLIPESPPMVPPPEPVTNFVEIPGRIRGPLDLSRVPFNKMFYQRVEGTWNFVCEGYPMGRMELYEEMRTFLHGKQCIVKLEDDPTHMFFGRFSITAPSYGRALMQISINFNLEPVRYNSDGTIDEYYVDNQITPDPRIGEAVSDYRPH